MINAETLRPLFLQTSLPSPSTLQPTAPEHAFISAASGLSWVNDTLYVVADDALHLGIFNRQNSAPGTSIALLEGELPLEHKARKAQKPDFEVLTHWQNFSGAPGGALLALGSGSKKNRCTGVLIPLDSHGSITGEAKAINLSALYAQIEKHVPSLNIEGALFTQNELWLFQRGNSVQGKNAIIRLNQSNFLQWMHTTDDATAITPDMRVQDIALGDLNGVPLGFTDATCLSNGNILFAAAAEDTEDTYNDGQCAGSVIGLMRSDGVILWQSPLNQPCKVEGIAARQIDGQNIECLMVTDADDAAVPAVLLSTRIAYTSQKNPR